MQKKISHSADIEYVDEKGDGLIVGWTAPPGARIEGIREHLIIIFSEDPASEDRQHRYVEGDKITVVETITLVRIPKSLTPVYLLPVAVLVGSLLLLVLAGVNQGIAGLASLGILALYYLVLYRFRHKLYREESRKYSFGEALQGKDSLSDSVKI
jgi:hypothetical protein